jgi:hypothetical protein
MMRLTVDAREHAAILAGLRLLQHYLEDSPPIQDGIQDILTNIDQFTALTVEEIDQLCERLNTR